jgi:hypothetical protein
VFARDLTKPIPYFRNRPLFTKIDRYLLVGVQVGVSNVNIAPVELAPGIGYCNCHVAIQCHPLKVDAEMLSSTRRTTTWFAIGN